MCFSLSLSFSLTLSLTPYSHVLFFPLWVFGKLSASRLPGPEEAKSVEASAAFNQVSLLPQLICVCVHILGSDSDSFIQLLTTFSNNATWQRDGGFQ